MPGPYCTAAEVLDEIQGRLNLVEAKPPPEHWQGLVPHAIARGYAKMIGLLGRRGYTPAAVDAWAFRTTYNRDLAVAHCFLNSRFAQDALGDAPRLELEQLEKELGSDEAGLALFDAGGSPIAPDLVTGGAASGRQPDAEADRLAIEHW